MSCTIGFMLDIFGGELINKVICLMNNQQNISVFSEKILQGLRDALRKLVEESAAKSESLVISDQDGNIRTVSAKELLENLRK